jgi:hypothetical protein
MRFVSGKLNKQYLQNILNEAMIDCVRVRAAVAYANKDNMHIFESCDNAGKPLIYYGRYDYTVPVSPEILKWFLDKNSPNLVCKLVPDILHAKVIWWEGAGAYIGSANLSDRAWVHNIEVGVFFSEDELEAQGLDLQLEKFFDQIEDASWELTDELYQEMKKQAQNRAANVIKSDHESENEFNKSRRIPKKDGLSTISSEKSESKRLNNFVKEWESTLQLMRGLAERIARDENRPTWLSSNVPAGVQADQFLHAYYYKQVRDGVSYPYLRFYEENKNHPEKALKEVINWWRSGEYEHSSEERTIYEWAPYLKEALDRERLLKLSQEEFSETLSRIYAVREHASKQKNHTLGLPQSQQSVEDKVRAFGRSLYLTTSEEGKSTPETIYFVLYGGPTTEIAQRIWMAKNSPTWHIPHFGLSSLGEIVGWAMPNQFPPRNMRSSKALKALGNNVSIYM